MESKLYGALVLIRRVDLHAIDATPARWRGRPDTLVDFHTGKHILRARWESGDTKDRDVIGGCYFFESVEDVEAYLNSDFWLKCERETQWKEVVGEVFEIVP